MTQGSIPYSLWSVVHHQDFVGLGLPSVEVGVQSARCRKGLYKEQIYSSKTGVIVRKFVVLLRSRKVSSV